VDRGFDVDDIRFVFHATLPLDLTEYIQQTGRAGRDGKPAHCILFYRAQDFAIARNIKIQSNATKDVIKSFEQDVIDLASYAMSRKCRYSLLAAIATIDECKPSEQRCSKDAQCDNCKGKRFQTFELPLMHIFDSINNHSLWSLYRGQDSLSCDLLQLLLKTQVLKMKGNQIQQGVNFDQVHQQLKSGFTRLVVTYDQRIDSPSTSNNCAAIKQVRSLGPETDDLIPWRPLRNEATAVADPLDSLRIPFLVRFEAER
jgi:superfamily II DNA/RNA helicase